MIRAKVVMKSAIRSLSVFQVLIGSFMVDR